MFLIDALCPCLVFAVYDSMIHKISVAFLLQFFLMNTHFNCVWTDCVLLLIKISAFEYPVQVC
jgi:hypothetical protein